MRPADDPSHEGNSPKYHTGEPCITPGCLQPAGTWWSKNWCQKHNAERLARITRQLDDITAKHKAQFPDF